MSVTLHFTVQSRYYVVAENKKSGHWSEWSTDFVCYSLEDAIAYRNKRGSHEQHRILQTTVVSAEDIEENIAERPQ